MNTWKPASYQSVSPYLLCQDAEEAIRFISTAFGGVVERRFDHPDGSLMHAELRIDDSIVMLGGGVAGATSGAAHMHLYVEDALATFERAVAAGAEVVQHPTRKKADDDLRGGVLDSCGTTWWIATQ